MRKWNVPQTILLKSRVRYIDLEGAVRAGKTTPAIWKLINYAIEFPGIQMMICRWTSDSLEAQLKPKFYEECPPELLGEWDARMNCQLFTNGSRLYMRSLKASDDKARYSKFAGLTLAIIYVDQPEELPLDIFQALKARLSQPGYPQQMILTPNPPAPNHWLATEFPETNPDPSSLYLWTSVYDNRAILGEDYIRELERDYPAGHVLRRRFIEGRRGLSIEGEPVYGKIFNRHVHVQEVEWIPDLFLYESWDFGQKHPAVSWHQLLDNGWWNVLGCYMGAREFIDEAVLNVARLRHEFFPGLDLIQVCCDPSGATAQGLRNTSVKVLTDHLRETFGRSIGVAFKTNANRPAVRNWCVQQISSYMTRLIHGRTALAIHPRADILIDGFEAGYVFDDRMLTNAAAPNIRRPRKDGYYDHLQNTVEYFHVTFGVGSPSENEDRSGSRRPPQHDDSDDWQWDRPRRTRRSRAGY